MNPEINTQMSEPVSTAPVPKTPHLVNQVTTVSKYLALTLFILLPFIGGYIGYVYAPEKVVEVIIVNETPSSSPAMVQDQSDNTNVSGDETPSLTPYLEVELTREFDSTEAWNLAQSNIFVVTSNNKELLGMFEGNCNVALDSSDLLNYRTELRNFIRTNDQIIARVYCGLQDSGQEIVMYKPFGGQNYEFSVLSMKLNGGEGLPTLPSDIVILKTFINSN